MTGDRVIPNAKRPAVRIQRADGTHMTYYHATAVVAADGRIYITPYGIGRKTPSVVYHNAVVTDIWQPAK